LGVSFAALCGLVLGNLASGVEAPQAASYYGMKTDGLVYGALEKYEEAKVMLVSYVPGRIATARRVCEKAGLTVVAEDRPGHFILCTWAKAKLQPALTALKKADQDFKDLSRDERGLILSIEPDYFRPVDLLPPGGPKAPPIIDEVVLRRAEKRKTSGIGPVWASEDLVTQDASAGRDGSGGRRTPNDPRYKDLWGMEQINAPKAWQSTNSTEIVVAVLDSGVDYRHEDLEGNMFVHDGKNPADGNTVHRKIFGFDYGSQAQDPNFKGLPDPAPIKDPGGPPFDIGHGTHCAGIIGAIGNNGVGVAGVK